MDNRLVEIYVKNFIKGQINFDGIILTPRIEKEKFKEYRIYWSVSNPNDISYTSFAIKGKIEQTLEEYFEVIGDPFAGNYNRRGIVKQRYINFDDSLDSLYISSKMEKTIEDKLKEEVVIQYGNYQITAKGFDYGIESYNEELTFEAKMMILEVVYKKLDAVLDEDDIKNFLEDVFKNGDEHNLYDSLTWHFSGILYNTPTVIDKDEMYMRDVVFFFDENQDEIEFEWG